MKIEIITSYPTLLKNKIFKAANDKNATLETWEIEKGDDGIQYLTHVTGQYNNEVILKLTVDSDSEPKKIIVTPHKWKGKPSAGEGKIAIVLGMFTATLLTHFKTDFDHLETK